MAKDYHREKKDKTMVIFKNGQQELYLDNYD